MYHVTQNVLYSCVNFPFFCHGTSIVTVSNASQYSIEVGYTGYKP
jgi:hypothetical protein